MWELMKKIQAALPTASLMLRDHTGECNDCDCTITKQGVLVRIAVGPFTFSREIAR
jgi:hypothetical protein